MAKKENKKETKEIKKKEKELTKKNKKKKEDKVPKENYIVGVKSEMSKVKWPSKKEVIKYTVATIVFVLILVAFFILMSLIMAGIREAFN